MKKFLTILIAGFIGFLGIFTTTSTAKNSAEPQYFLQSERKNAAAYENNNITIYLDNTVNNYEETIINIGNTNTNSKVYYLDTNLNKNLAYNLSDFEANMLIFNTSSNENFIKLGDEIVIGIKNKDIESDPEFNILNNTWYCLIANSDYTGYEFIPIKGLIIEGITLVNNINEINTYLEPYIGNYLPSNNDSETNENTTIEQIGKIINDTTNWFVNIFIGLSDIFYSNGTLGVWGSVLFLSVAFTLITMCLKWVISLIRGI